MMSGSTKDQGPQSVDRHGYLFGQKIAKSYSPLIHGTIHRDLGLRWELRLLDSTDIAEFLELLRDPACFGKSRPRPLDMAACHLTLPRRFSDHAQ